MVDESVVNNVLPCVVIDSSFEKSAEGRYLEQRQLFGVDTVKTDRNVEHGQVVPLFSSNLDRPRWQGALRVDVRQEHLQDPVIEVAEVRLILDRTQFFAHGVEVYAALVRVSQEHRLRLIGSFGHAHFHKPLHSAQEMFGICPHGHDAKTLVVFFDVVSPLR